MLYLIICIMIHRTPNALSLNEALDTNEVRHSHHKSFVC